MINVACNDNFDTIAELEETLATARWAQQIEKEQWFRDAMDEALAEYDKGERGRPAREVFDEIYAEIRKKHGYSHVQS